MSSHREAPEISKDPVADSTDTYAFVSPDRPGFVTLITNYIPLQNPAGGPNFFEFGDDVSYKINVDNNGDGRADVVYEFRFTTTVVNPDTFLYNTGPDHLDQRQHVQPTPALPRHPHRTRTAPRAWPRPHRARRATSVPGRRRTTRSWPRPPWSRPEAGARCSQANGSTGSTSTSGRCSTCSICGRSRACTSSPRPPRTESTGCAPTTCTPWPSRCRSAISPSTDHARPIRCRPPR